MEIKSWLKNIGVGAWSKVGVAILVKGHYNWVYLKKELIEKTDFRYVNKNSGKLKVTLIIFGW